MTAKEHIERTLDTWRTHKGDENGYKMITSSDQQIAELMIAFAQEKIKEALEAIVDNVEMVGQCVHQPERPKLTSDSVYEEDPNGPDYIWTVSKESILEAYPLENIK